MKVAHILTSISRQGGGVAEAVRSLVAELAADDAIDVQVISCRDELTDQDLSRWPVGRVRTHAVFGPRKFAFSPGLFLDLAKMKPDVIHIHGLWQFHCLAVVLWAKLTGTPYIISPHGMLEPWIQSRSVLLKRLISILWQDEFVKRAHLLHALTAFEAQDIAKLYPSNKIAIIPNFVTLVSDVNRPQWWEPEFDDSVVFLFLGRIHKKKGVSELIDAWKLCRSDHADFRKRARLVFAGWVDSDPELERALEKVADGLNVQYVGPQRGLERDRTYHSSRFFILPSFSEGLPMAVLEAWAAGVPALMTRECNLPEGFESGAAVEILNEPTALAQSLQSAFSMPMDMYKKMKDASLDLVSRKYSKHSVVSRFIAVYRDSRS